MRKAHCRKARDYENAGQLLHAVSGNVYSEHAMRPPTYLISTTIGQISRTDVVKRGFEEFSLKNGRDIRDNNNDPRMQWLLAEERKKIGAIVGYKRELPLADHW